MESLSNIDKNIEVGLAYYLDLYIIQKNIYLKIKILLRS